MELQEKMNMFWATGVLPGSVFDDLNDRKIRPHAGPYRHRSSYLRSGVRKLHRRCNRLKLAERSGDE